jgi:hypothetical protein
MFLKLECRAIRRDLWDFAGDRLSEGPLERVERHLHQCASCRAEAEGLRRAQFALREVQQEIVPPPVTGWEALQRRLETEPQPIDYGNAARPSLANGWMPKLAGATALACLLLTTAFGYRVVQIASQTEGTISAFTENNVAPEKPADGSEEETTERSALGGVFERAILPKVAYIPTEATPIANAPSAAPTRAASDAPKRNARPKSFSGSASLVVTKRTPKRAEPTPFRFESRPPTPEERDALTQRARTQARPIMPTLTPVSHESASSY